MYDFFLKYPRTVFEQGELTLTLEWPLWIAGVLFVFALLLVTGTLVSKRGEVSFPGLLSIGLLQLLMVVLVLLLIWRPALLTEELRPGENIVALMLDNSGSMNYRTSGSSRMQSALAVINGPEIQSIQQDHELQRFLFSDAVEPVDSFTDLPEAGQTTRLTEAVSQVLSLSRTNALAAVIIVSDGADNAGTLTQQQLAEISAYGVPVHAIGAGRSRIEEDLELQDVVLPRQTLDGAILSARVAIRHDRPGLARVKAYEGDRLLATTEVELPPSAGVTTAWIDLDMTDPGYHTLSFTVEPWADEQVMVNNTRTRVLEVRKEKYRVLYIEGEPRWEYKFIRRALEQDSGVELVTLLRVSQNRFYRQGITHPQQLESGFPADTSELFSYHALLIGSIEAAMFTPEQQGLIRDFVSVRGGSLLMLAGLNGLGNGRWENSSISEILPVELPTTGNDFVRKQVKAVLTPAGQDLSMLNFSADREENRRLWQELPDIADYQTIGVLKPLAASLLNIAVNGKQQPLLVRQPYGRGWSYVLATGGTWRWQMQLPHEDQRHETFWRQLLREMVIHSPGRFELDTGLVAGKARISAEVLDQDYRPEQGMELTAVITSPAGESLMLALQQTEDTPGLMTAEFSAGESGLYTIEAISRRAGQVVNATRMALYSDADEAEYFSFRMNPDLLRQLTENTGGKVWAVDDIEGLAEAIRYSSAGISERKISPLWDAPLIFLLLLLIKAMEWSLRRRWKTI